MTKGLIVLQVIFGCMGAAADWLAITKLVPYSLPAVALLGYSLPFAFMLYYVVSGWALRVITEDRHV